MVVKTTRVEVIPTIGKRTINSSTNMAGGKKKTGRKKGKGQAGGKINWAKVERTAGNIERWLRKNKVISRTAGALSSVGVPYAGSVGAVASKLGYGKQSGRGALKF